MNTSRPLHQPLRALLLTAFCLAALLRSGPPVAAAEAFTLIGTATFTGGAFAVFDGSRGEFKAYVHPGEMIGECRLLDIQADRVRLATPKGEIELTMDKQLRRDETGTWQLAPLTEPFTARELPARADSESAPSPVVPPATTRSLATFAEPAEKPDKSPKKSGADLSKIERKVLEASQSGKDPLRFERDLVKKVQKQAAKESRQSL